MPTQEEIERAEIEQIQYGLEGEEIKQKYRRFPKPFLIGLIPAVLGFSIMVKTAYDTLSFEVDQKYKTSFVDQFLATSNTLSDLRKYKTRNEKRQIYGQFEFDHLLSVETKKVLRNYDSKRVWVLEEAVIKLEADSAKMAENPQVKEYLKQYDLGKKLRRLKKKNFVKGARLGFGGFFTFFAMYIGHVVKRTREFNALDKKYKTSPKKKD